MGSKLYVGNLSYDVTDADLSKMFEPHGSVSSAQIIQDRDSGRSKGFGFVQMGSDAEAQAAITALHDKEQNGRNLTVNEAKPREDRPRSGGGGGGGGGGYNRGGGGSSGGSRSGSSDNSSSGRATYVERGSTGGRSENKREKDGDRDGNRRY